MAVTVEEINALALGGTKRSALRASPLLATASGHHSESSFENFPFKMRDTLGTLFCGVQTGRYSEVAAFVIQPTFTTSQAGSRF